MARTDAQKRAQKNYYEENREKLLAYKSKYWQLNKHKWSPVKTEPVVTSEPVATATATEALN